MIALSDAVTLFIDGAVLMAFLTAGFFFLKFWRRTWDRLFLLFAISFWIMAVNRLLLSFYINWGPPAEHITIIYVIRLLAFVVILFAIIDKNRSVKNNVRSAA
jgi:hypothetical protein